MAAGGTANILVENLTTDGFVINTTSFLLLTGTIVDVASANNAFGVAEIQISLDGLTWTTIAASPINTNQSAPNSMTVTGGFTPPSNPTGNVLVRLFVQSNSGVGTINVAAGSSLMVYQLQ